MRSPTGVHLAAAAAALLLGAPAAAAPLFKVGGEVVDSAKVDRGVAEVSGRMKARGQALSAEQKSRLKTRLARDLLEEELIEHGIESAKLKVSKAELDAAVARKKEQFRHEKGFRAWLAATGQTVDDVRREAKEQLLVEKLVEKHLKKKAPTFAEAEEELAENPDQFRLPASADLRQILIPKPEGASAPELDEVRRRAVGIARKAAQNPRTFPSLAQSHSKGPAAQLGGRLGRVRQGRMGHRFDRVVFRADPGTVVGPIETPTAFHIVLVEDRHPAEPMRLVKPVPAAWRQLYARYEAETRGPLLARLYRLARVEVLDPEVKLSGSELAAPEPGEMKLPGEGRRGHEHGHGKKRRPTKKPR